MRKAQASGTITGKRQAAAVVGSPAETVYDCMVVGNGWAALGLVGYLSLQSKMVLWVQGSGARLSPPLASLTRGIGARAFAVLAERLGITLGDLQIGTLLKVRRGKAFREPHWLRGDTREEQQALMQQGLWGPEATVLGLESERYDLTAYELEEAMRAVLLRSGERLRVVEDNPLMALKKNEGAQGGVGSGRVWGLELGSGETFWGTQVFYADQLGLLAGLEGLPQALTLQVQREPMGALQAVFKHQRDLGLGGLDSFCSEIAKTAGDQGENRHLWGYFTQCGWYSIWTVYLSAAEIEDNHQIAKRLRRMKSTLNKVFEDLTPYGESGQRAESGGEEAAVRGSGHALPPPLFTETLAQEQVRFVQELLFGAGMKKTRRLGGLKNPWGEAGDQAARLEEWPEVCFLTDGFGPAQAFAQVVSALGLELGHFDTQAEKIDLGDSALLPEQLGCPPSGGAGGEEIVHQDHALWSGDGGRGDAPAQDGALEC